MNRPPRPLAALATLARLAAAAGLLAAVPAPAAAPPPVPPQARELGPAADLPGIFTYRVDAACRITGVRKLQGPDALRWPTVTQAFDLFGERTVWRMVDGERRQFLERRVTLSGEIVEGGELYCLLTPMGQLFDAWINRSDPEGPRQRLPRREPAPVRNGALGDLGTFSVVYPPTPS